ncbi:SDR family oxidoreductase [Clostridium fungisolvens]|uniref:General stress protein 39 n=1 Tax=Clostridium fungisolvens TaxID=1604897 RepID=A0A6V8SR32_9CLOT|nr:SDR family oxidoreductase [Clostridium fungisolvens]GFP77658.1 General stress protein 39 [Clostridium fungisolvens]
MKSPNNPCDLPTSFPPQHQPQQPGIEFVMNPRPEFQPPPDCVLREKKLLDKVALITGGDSGIGRSVALAFAKEGADIAIVYLNEHIDAKETKEMIEQLGRKCIAIAIDISKEKNCKIAVQMVLEHFNKIDILVNNAGVIYPHYNFEDITDSELEWLFHVNVFSYFYFSKAVLPHMKPGSCIINTSSIASFIPYGIAIDYEASKGAITSFTQSLAKNLIRRGIRVNSVAPGEVWTPLIPAAFTAEATASWGSETPMGRSAQPYEIAPAYVYLASDESSYMTGQTIHVYS